MQCSNCGARVPSGMGACPECGVFARVVAPATRGSRKLVWLLLLLATAAGVATWVLRRPPESRRASMTRAPIHVVRDRPGGARVAPGAAISEPEAMLRLMRSFDTKPECVAIMSKGYHDGAWVLEAINHCDRTRSGRWLVDGHSGTVRPALPKR